MDDFITPNNAIEFYQTLVALLRGDDAVTFVPSADGTKVTVHVANALAARKRMNAEIQNISETPYVSLMAVSYILAE